MSKTYELIKSNALDKWETLVQGKPWIRVGGGVSGEAAGSDEIFATVKKSIKENGLDVNISSVGSIGLMYLEPIIDIKTPNGPRIFYGNVEQEDVVDIVVKHLIDNQPLFSKAFAYEGLPNEVVENIDELSTLPAINYQKKIVTKNFGNIDPNDIDQYIANGGYKALDIAVNERTPGEVVDEVKNSGLRG
ncbi:MAG: hypothetical protein FI685_06100, partial [SAR202 cluster bacterium]|nr:hypothetical protein [SAR202 cluster bacterium]